MQVISPRQRVAGQMSGSVIAGIIIALGIVILATLYFLRPEPEPLPVPDTPRTTPLETVAPAQTAKERGDSAREIIEKLRANPAGVDYAEAHRRAQAFQADGNFADAQLLYFLAARGGYAPSAYELATLYDPNHASTGSGLMEDPDPFQAYKWYRSARDAGNNEAASRLDELHAWAVSAADAGDEQAERLLLQWE